MHLRAERVEGKWWTRDCGRQPCTGRVCRGQTRGDGERRRRRRAYVMCDKLFRAS